MELNGTGYGYGYGYGYGDGSGDGYGYGDGSGDGYGTGYGYGDGSGDGYWEAVKETHAIAFQGTIGFWVSDSAGRPSNGGDGEPVTEGMTQEVAGPLRLCNKGFHATNNPGQWKGSRIWIVGLHPPIVKDGDKMASLKRTILKEIPLGRTC